MNQDTSWDNVVDLGGGEEYFASDYDQVHCRHGVYIGYPGGPDYMCGACESGFDTLRESVAYDVMWENPEGELQRVFTKYDRAEAYGFVDQIEALAEANEADTPLFSVRERVEKWWGPADE